MADRPSTRGFTDKQPAARMIATRAALPFCFRMTEQPEFNISLSLYPSSNSGLWMSPPQTSMGLPGG
jgi:hypothetical protein